MRVGSSGRTDFRGEATEHHWNETWGVSHSKRVETCLGQQVLIILPFLSPGQWSNPGEGPYIIHLCSVFLESSARLSLKEKKSVRKMFFLLLVPFLCPFSLWMCSTNQKTVRVIRIIWTATMINCFYNIPLKLVSRVICIFWHAHLYLLNFSHFWYLKYCWIIVYDYLEETY